MHVAVSTRHVNRLSLRRYGTLRRFCHTSLLRAYHCVTGHLRLSFTALASAIAIVIVIVIAAIISCHHGANW